jgi:hypothetical protein
VLTSAVIVMVLAGASGCGESTADGQSALEAHHGATSAPTTTTPSGSGPARSGSAGSESTGPNIDPIAGRYTPVQRNGSVPTPHILARTEPFTRQVRYPDHITVGILGVHQSVSHGHGPGEMAGRPVTTMRIRFGNFSQRRVDLTQVVVTVIYGSEGRIASPVYQNAEQDFHSMVRPGHTAVATYAFSVPKSELGHVVMKVDFDGLHAAATFAGPLS